ncbi:hypothetical protein [Streptomyces sp. MBT98]|uniref:hypothetical protein n=1 Tax=unclassified Streptomyces TaxID=2593676 RepID=UPI0035AC15C6
MTAAPQPGRRHVPVRVRRTRDAAAPRKEIRDAAAVVVQYERDSFKHGVDEDDDCPTRQEVLLAEAVTAPEQGGRCTLTGGSRRSNYDEAEVIDAKKLDIDHVVPLAEAWDSK